MTDLTGKKFGMLTVIERAPDRIRHSGARVPMWRCICDCGKERIVEGKSLRHDEVYSCGCTKRKQKHWKDVEIVDIKRPAPITIQHSLMIGRVYKINGKSKKLIGLYPTYARFEDENGFRDCYLYWDLQRILVI